MTEQIKTTLIVTYNDNVKVVKTCRHTDHIKCNRKVKLEHVKVEILQFDTEADALKAKADLEKDEDVLAVEFDSIIEMTESIQNLNDPLASSVWSLNPNSNIPNDNFHSSKLINMKIPTSNPDVVIAIIDDCIYTPHPDLRGKLVDGFDAGSEKLESNGGEMWMTNNSAINHGTLVTGVAVANSNNGIGGASIGGMFNNVKVLPIRAANLIGGILDSYTVVGLNHAISRGVDVISMSFAPTIVSAAFKTAINKAHNAGIALFAGRGNHGTDEIRYPANLSNVLAIASVDSDMKLSRWSSTQASAYGDVAFVGNGSGVARLFNDGTVKYTTHGGTSSASPHIASIYAAMKAVNPSASRELLLAIMDITSHKIPDTYKHGKGYPNAVEAVRLSRAIGTEYDEFPTAVNQPTNKEWVVTFNNDVNPSYLTGVYVMSNINGKEHPVTAKVNPSNPKQVIVTPKTPYLKGQSYILVVADLVNTVGKEIGQSVSMVFSIA